MPTFDSFAAFERELAKFGKELETVERSRITREQAEAMQSIATRVASADLGGDPKFSGWAPTLDTQLKDLRSGATLLTPTKISAGPWTVAEIGRNQGNAGGFAGPGVSVRTGGTSRNKDGSLRKVRKRKAKRWNGVTRGFGTASSARSEVERVAPQIAVKGLRRATRRHFDTEG
ncbi:hypothetical protein EBZ38_14630 [bacterium]|nr:hypothetical protein [bacterium]NDD85494.1 hypothetical protein [bacterium]NDG19181.1 hypothetical protein [Betaproteobacteria bacterium]